MSTCLFRNEWKWPFLRLYFMYMYKYMYSFNCCFILGSLTVFTRTITLTNCAPVFQRAGGGDKNRWPPLFFTYFLICANTILFYVVHEEISRICRRHNCRRKTAKCLTRLWLLSWKGSLSCHTPCDTRPRSSRSHLQARHNAVASTDKQGVMWTCWLPVPYCYSTFDFFFLRYTYIVSNLLVIKIVDFINYRF